ncbi:hypothetical protein [Salmonella bongori]
MQMGKNSLSQNWRGTRPGWLAAAQNFSVCRYRDGITLRILSLPH